MLAIVTARSESGSPGRPRTLPRRLDALAIYQHVRIARTRAFSRLVSRSFGAFGEGSAIELPVLVHGAKRIVVGRHVHIGSGSWLATQGEDGLLEIGDGTRLSGQCVLSA